jgi:predicted flap endonuclease-1-like 5' DNA nuclease
MGKLVEIEGIGSVFAQKLEGAGLKTTAQLLESGKTSAGRRKLVETTGITAEKLLDFVNRADLMRVAGVGPQFSDLLEAAGVDTVKELVRRDPESLHTKLLKVNEEKNLVNRLPTLREVEAMIAHAKTLPTIVTH